MSIEENGVLHTDWWKTIAMFCLGALFSGAIFLFRDIPTRNDMREALQFESDLRQEEDREQKTQAALQAQQLSTVREDIAAIKANLQTMTAILKKGD